MSAVYSKQQINQFLDDLPTMKADDKAHLLDCIMDHYADGSTEPIRDAFGLSYFLMRAYQEHTGKTYSVKEEAKKVTMMKIITSQPVKD